MVRRVCVMCGIGNNTADTVTDTWICLNCGAEIPREEDKSETQGGGAQ